MRVLLIAYDNGSHVHSFPLGLAYLAAYLRREDYYVEIYNQDIYHYLEDHLTKYLDENKFDVVGLGFIAGYSQYKKVLSISNAINKSKNRPIYILGGHGPTPEPGYFLKKTGADYVVLGEGEITFTTLLKTINCGANPKHVYGIAYLENGVVTNPKIDSMIPVDDILFPEWGLFDINYYALFQSPGFSRTDRTMFMITGRGCPYKCTFCYRMDKGFKPRSPKSIVDEMKALKKLYGITALMFADELLMSSVTRTVEVCEEIIKADIGMKWYCNGRLNVVTKELLKVMNRAGCVFINYGVECLDDEVLKKMEKKLTVKQIYEGVEWTREEGLEMGLNVMAGNIGETTQTIIRTAGFVNCNDSFKTMRTIRPVTPYPGSPLYYYAIEKGLLGGVEDFYENKHINADMVTVNFTEMTTDELYVMLYAANKLLIESYYGRANSRALINALDFYSGKNKAFRGFRQQ